MYTLNFTAEADRDFDRLDRANQQRILKRLEWLAANAEEVRHETVTGPLAGLFKFRVGDYRVLYDLSHQEHTLLVQVIRHRREVYK